MEYNKITILDFEFCFDDLFRSPVFDHSFRQGAVIEG